jgi:hypothetical protein
MRHAVYLSLLVVFFACSSRKTVDEKSFRVFVTDTAVNHRSTNELDFSIRNSGRLNLPHIHRGVDSFELRIWVSGISKPSQLLILRFTDSKWDFLKYDYYTGGKTIDSVFGYRQEIPRGIDSLVEYLQQPDLLALPSQDAIPRFTDNISDGQTCTIEISTSNFYKAVAYHCAEHYDEKNNRQFMSVVGTLNGYFMFYFPLCKPTP